MDLSLKSRFCCVNFAVEVDYKGQATAAGLRSPEGQCISSKIPTKVLYPTEISGCKGQKKKWFPDEGAMNVRLGKSMIFKFIWHP